MRSMYRFSMVALAVGALALCMAGSALAAQHEGMAKGISISGSMTADIENVAADRAATGSSSQLGVQSEAVLDFSASSGAVSFKVRLEANDENVVDNLRNQIVWQVTDGFSITISGSSYGETATSSVFGASTVGHFTQAGSAAGHRASNTQYVFGVNDGSADFRFKTGGITAGLVLNPEFALEGAVAADTSETMTLSPYFIGQFGSLGVYFQHSIASGKNGGTAGTPTDPEASETSIAVIFKSGQMAASLQLAPGTKTTNAGAESDTNSIALGLSFGGIKFHYITEEEETSGGTTVEDNTDIAVSYSMAINEKAEWTVGYAVNSGLRVESSAAASITSVDGKVSVLSWGLGLKF